MPPRAVTVLMAPLLLMLPENKAPPTAQSDAGVHSGNRRRIDDAAVEAAAGGDV